MRLREYETALLSPLPRIFLRIAILAFLSYSFLPKAILFLLNIIQQHLIITYLLIGLGQVIRILNLIPRATSFLDFRLVILIRILLLSFRGHDTL